MPENSVQLPNWLTKDYLEQKLRLFYKDDKLHLLQFVASAASAKGDNYVGTLTRLHVDYECGNGQVQQSSYLLKEPCDSNLLEFKYFEEMQVYRREMYMYEFVLPQMSRLLQQAGLTEKLHANALCVDHKYSTIILEDLAPLQYRIANRKERLDLQHVQLALQMLARYHASAAVLKQRTPELFVEIFARHFFARHNVGYKNIITGVFLALLRYIKSESQLEKLYYAKLRRVFDNLLEYGARCFDVAAEDFQSLTHGDCWTTNIMFRYDGTDPHVPSAVLPIDFQFSSWSAPATDLHYFFSSSLREDVHKRQTELVQLYYYALRGTLERLNFKGIMPSLQEFQLQFERRRFLAVFVSLCFQPIMMYEGHEEPKFQSIFEETPEALRFQQCMFGNPKIQQIVKRLLPIYDAQGLLDTSK